IGHRSLEFIHPDDHDKAIRTWGQLLSTEIGVPVLIRHQHKSGEWRWMQSTNRLFRGDERIGHIVNELVDVTDTVLVDETANHSYVLTARVGALVKDERALIVAVDRSACAMLGWMPEDIIGKRSLDLVHPDDQVRSIANFARGLNGGQRQRTRLRLMK